MISGRRAPMFSAMALVLALSGAAVQAAPMPGAETYTIDGDHSEATFRIRHLITKVTGKVPVKGTIVMVPADLAKSSVEVVIDPAAISTGVDARDKDLRSARFFDVATFPSITFKSSSVAVVAKDKLKVTGPLTLHGVTRTVVIAVDFNGTGQGPKPGTVVVGFDGSASLDRTDFGIKTLASDLLDSGMVGKEVTINLSIEADKVQ